MNTKAKLIAMLIAGSVVATGRAETNSTFKSDLEKYSYAAGQFYAGDWKRREMDFDMEQLMRGVKDAQAGKSLFNDQEVRDMLNKFSQENFSRQQEKRKKEGENFLAANKTKPGVITLEENGLQYKVLTEGTGAIPKPTDTVTVNYRGTFVDGTEFDSSAKAGKPFTTRVTGGIIRGWTEALSRMKTGAKWQLFIPPALAYGEQGRQPIPPNSTLIFEVELLSIQPPPPPPPPATPLTSDIIKVPSLEEMKKGAQIETIKAEEVEKLQKQQQPPKPKQ